MFRQLPGYLIVLAAGSVLLAGCGSSSSSSVSASLSSKQLPPIKPPAFVPGPLDGESTARAKALRRPLAIMVENYSPDSRPHSGLSQASTVIETLAEGGITRFMAIYLEKDVAKVGPVRSTRIYFNHWATGFHSILTHVGGSEDALHLLWNAPKVFNIDENRWEKSLFDTGTPLFWRAKDRQAPHNMYVNTFKLRAYAQKHHENWAYSEAFFKHKRAAGPSQRGKASTISVQFVDPIYPGRETGPYAVKYVYDRKTNAYTRFMGGVPHVDRNNGRVLKPSNVIIMQTGPALADPGAGSIYDAITIPNVGTGKAWFFRDGHVASGRWQQKDPNAPLRFFDRRGKQVALNPGQTWIEVTPPSSHSSWTSR